MKLLKQMLGSVFENVLSWVTLALIIFITVSYFFQVPYTGLFVNLTNQGWVITSVNQGNPLQVGDILTRVGTMTSIEAQQDLTKGFFNSIQNGETIEIAFERQGRPLTISYTLPGFNAEELFSRLNSQWFVPFIFWLAGGAVLLFLRPRSLLRHLLALFCFLNAAWISMGSISGWHIMSAALVLRSLVWLSVPVYLHLHWLFPSPLRALPNWVWAILYGIFAILAAVSWFQFLPQNLYLLGFILAVAGSLILLVVHLIKQPDERRALRGMVVAIGFILLPMIVVAALSIVRIQVIYAQIIVLGLVALPGFYFFTLYNRQLTPAKSYQAIQLVRTYFFLIIGGLLFCLAFSLYAGLLITNTQFTNQTLVVPLILSVIALISFIPFLVLPALADERITINLGASAFGFSANRAASGIIFLFFAGVGRIITFYAHPLAQFPWCRAAQYRHGRAGLWTAQPARLHALPALL